MVTHTRNLCSAINPSKVHTHSEHTHTHTHHTPHTHTHTHTQWTHTTHTHTHTNWHTHPHTHTHHHTHTTPTHHTHTHTQWTHTWTHTHPHTHHTHTVNTHLELWAAIYAVAPGEKLGFGVLLKGSSVVVLRGGGSAVHSLPPPTIPAGPRLELATFRLRVWLSKY